MNVVYADTKPTQIWHHRKRTFIAQKGAQGWVWLKLGIRGPVSPSPVIRRLRKGSYLMQTMAYPVPSTLSPPFLETQVP